LTFGQFDLLLERKEEMDRKAWMHTGLIVANVINFSMCHPDQTVSMMDFVPKRRNEKEQNLLEMAPEQQAAAIIGKMTKKNYKR
jgi:hypothetical protein